MRWYRVAAMTRKEVIQIRRDVRSLLIVVAMPVVLILTFGYAISLDVKHVPVYVFDREGSQPSQDVLKHFQASDYFNLVRAVDNYPALIRAIDDGSCQLALVIPSDFSRKLEDGGPVHVQALVDGSDANSATLALNYSQAVIQAYSAQVQLNWLSVRGHTGAQPPLSVAARTWFNEDLESVAGIVPGMVAIVMSVIGSFLTALTIAREWERGTMEQLISTPVTPLEIMLGKLAPYVVIGMVDTALCAAIGVGWFHIPFRGKWSVFFGSSALFLMVVLSLGYFISVVAKSQLAASQASLIATFLPAFLLSGFLFPIDQMPAVIQFVTRVIPARYFVSIMRSVFLKGSPAVFLTRDLAALAVFALALTFLATRAFKKKLS
jgi:ABC-2 type transport system permease protein